MASRIKAGAVSRVAVVKVGVPFAVELRAADRVKAGRVVKVLRDKIAIKPKKSIMDSLPL